MPGDSKDLLNRYTKTWEKSMTKNGSRNLTNKQHSTVIEPSTTKSKKGKAQSRIVQQNRENIELLQIFYRLLCL